MYVSFQIVYVLWDYTSMVILETDLAFYLMQWKSCLFQNTRMHISLSLKENCGHSIISTELQSTVVGRKFVVWLNNYQLLKKDFAPSSRVVYC
jgi:hypothetical protein